MLTPETRQHYSTLADWCARRAADSRCPVIGINGAQGSGKSTLTHFLVDDLADRHGLRCGWLSLDDCYLGHAARVERAAQLHPLLVTRGVPGTHDVALGHALLRKLRGLADGQSLRLPEFSKAQDDRLPEQDWRKVEGPLDLVLFEGWCVGTPPQTGVALAEPVNALERDEDSDGRWRHYVNTQLAGAYADWFSELDAQVFLQVPDIAQVQVWRGQQEAETRQREGRGKGQMEEAALRRFIQHYERLTLHALRVMPDRADVCLRLDTRHAVVAARY